MNRASGIVAAVLALVYVVFWIWYGGSGEPLRPGEADALTERMAVGARSRGAEPDTHLIDAFRTLAEQDDGRSSTW